MNIHDILADLRNERWQDRALCAQIDPELWWPDKGGSTLGAKRICGRCDVRDECLEYAMDNGEHGGIWGGLSPRERGKLARERRRWNAA
jgi:hypothetical protein